ncbi:aspartyl/asparaginyl beta-hydroxylase domain-containing protein [Massilia sp. TS11]|uniref:aspartyl/asparaginyl beta-hydroxylase domain-containing protein n=1 Tax=Massilia sp. TS11 TaxID=2908003 RepID=UPI001ED9F3D2|nr:aspartyl/asparaginyl beta-hydroxylase domain-containing protein [Massilia sp. TS11]MCG2584990.1 aspartyl/asparaginyl beta-hydroxylase domain-containing protein [Massilia sp. TS11]
MTTRNKAQAAQNQVAQGVQFLSKGDAVRARQAFGAALAAGLNDDVTPHLGIAMACMHLGDQRAAMAALDQVLALEPRHLRALVFKADIFDAAGDEKAASSHYQAALMVAPPEDALATEQKNDLERARAALARYASGFSNYLRSELAKVDAPMSPRFAEALDLLEGKQKIYFQEPHFFYFPGLAPVTFFPRELFPWMDKLEAATDAIRAELQGILADPNAFAPYIQGDPRRATIAQGGMMNNPDWGAYYLVKDGMAMLDAIARCPTTMEVLKDAPISSIPGVSPSIMFSRLKPGTRIPPHTGMTNTRLICHLPLIVPGGCGFRVGRDVRHWEEGKAWAFDDTIEHEAWNDSAEERVILLFEIWRPDITEAERTHIAALFEAVHKQGGLPQDWAI